MIINDKKDEDKKINLNDEIYWVRDELKIHKRRRNIFSILIVVIIVLLPIAYAITFSSEEKNPHQSSSSNPQSLNLNQGLTYAPDFSAVDIVTGETISLNNFRKSIVILNFVNYGCNSRTNEIVSAQLMNIKSLEGQLDDFTTISVFCGCCPVDTLRDFAIENGLSWPWILDSDNSIIQNYTNYVREYGYPTLVFINKDQYIFEYGGYYDTSALTTTINEML